MAGDVGRAAQRNGTGLHEPEAAEEEAFHERYRKPLSLADVTFERCKLARDILALDYKDFMEDLDTNEDCPDYIKLASMQAIHAIRLWEATVAAWRTGGHR